jgi:hypothetical protein
LRATWTTPEGTVVPRLCVAGTVVQTRSVLLPETLEPPLPQFASDSKALANCAERLPTWLVSVLGSVLATDWPSI